MTTYNDLVTRLIGVAALCGRDTPCRADADEEVLTLKDRPDGSRLIRDDGSMGDAINYAGEVWVRIGTLPTEQEVTNEGLLDDARWRYAAQVIDRMRRLDVGWYEMDRGERVQWLSDTLKDIDRG